MGVRLLFFMVFMLSQAWKGATLERITIATGCILDQCPGAALLKGQGSSISIMMTKAEISGVNVTFRTPVYKSTSSAAGRAYIFGPTLRVKAGGPMVIKLANYLIDAAPKSSKLNGFHNPSHTNLHTHGLHDDAGNLDQYSTPQYTGGDNIFVTIPPRASRAAAPKSLTYDRRLPSDHTPGLYWYHPHAHGSTAVQAYTANGLIIAPSGTPPLPGTTAGDAAVLADQQTRNRYTVDANVQALGALSDPQNPLCCGDYAAASGEGARLAGPNSNADLMVVNGAWQPIIPLTSGVHQRWRVAHTGYKRFVDLQIVDAATKKPTSACELQLLAKDGLYLMDIPRKVAHIFLTSGNRAELMVKCTGAIGKRFILTAGNALTTPFFDNPVMGGGGGGMGMGGGGGGGGGMGNDALAHNQAIVAHLQITNAAATRTVAPVQKSCRPLTPTYAPDLRDAALAAAGGINNVFMSPATFTMAPGTGSGCYVNGQPFAYPDPSPVQLPLGKVVEMDFGRLAQHPMHVHTNPYQIVALPTPTSRPYTSWFEVGDRHDTLQIPVLSMNRAVKLRLQPGPYPGFDVMHCHLLQHEDSGCMKVTSMYCPGTDPSRKQPSKCVGVTYPVQGTIVTVAGVAEAAYGDGADAVAFSNHTVAMSPARSSCGGGMISLGTEPTSAAGTAISGSFIVIMFLYIFL